MRKKGVENFGARIKAMELFKVVLSDVGPLREDPRTWKLVSQQVASADSICANIEEGYGRGSCREFILFLNYARGSAYETRGRYERLSTWISPEVVQTRMALCTEIIALLSSTILTLKEKSA